MRTIGRFRLHHVLRHVHVLGKRALGLAELAEHLVTGMEAHHSALENRHRHGLPPILGVRSWADQPDDLLTQAIPDSHGAPTSRLRGSHGLNTIRSAGRQRTRAWWTRGDSSP